MKTYAGLGSILLWFCVSICTAQFNYFRINDAQSLRGISARSESECWVSGYAGKVFKTTDAGGLWIDVSPKGYDTLDFRDIELFDNGTAIIMSAGYPTRILKTKDGGISWKVVFKSDEKWVFLDAMDFWNDQQGIVFGDAIGHDLLVMRTEDQGDTWRQIDTADLPNVQDGQGGFAASGTCLKTFGKKGVVIGLGGDNADIVISRDRGESWIKTSAPLTAGASSAGIFSFSFLNASMGLCAGGDYTGDSASANSLAITKDGGQNWQLITDPAVNGFYHSTCLMLDDKTFITMSRYGSSWSFDGGKSWQRKQMAFYSLSGFKGGFWASGSDGRVVRWCKD